MDFEDQAQAYARANFAEAREIFMRHLNEKVGSFSGKVLDLGCGPAEISLAVAEGYLDCMVYAVDGSLAMLKQAQERLTPSSGAKGRVVLLHNKLTEMRLPQRHYQLVMSNSFLHHLHEPEQLWNAVKMFADSNAWIFMMDLMRPDSDEAAQELTRLYCDGAPAVLQKDFYHSLKAAFEIDEIRTQLREAGLEHLQTEPVSDRHVLIYGRM